MSLYKLKTIKIPFLTIDIIINQQCTARAVWIFLQCHYYPFLPPRHHRRCYLLLLPSESNQKHTESKKIKTKQNKNTASITKANKCPVICCKTSVDFSHVLNTKIRIVIDLRAYGVS